MSRRISLATSCLLFAAALLLLVTQEASAKKVKAYHQIPGTAFRPLSSSTGFGYDMLSSCVYATSGAGERWSAPLLLPDKAVVSQVRFYFLDNNSGAQSSLTFGAYSVSPATLAAYGTAYSSDLPARYADLAVNVTLNLENYNYFLNWIPNATTSSMSLCGVRVYYTADTQTTAVIIPIGK